MLSRSKLFFIRSLLAIGLNSCITLSFANGSLDDSFSTPASTARFLTQATFGANYQQITNLTLTSSSSSWFVQELNKTPTTFLEDLQYESSVHDQNELPNNAMRDLYWDSMITADDQLRQRMVWALSQIFVISTQSKKTGGPLAAAAFIDILSNNAFGNYRDLLEEVTYSYAMSRYLTYYKNRKANNKGRVPDENFAREIMQLFTIGLVELNLDGTPKLDSNGNTIETYTNDDITGLAKVFTGLAGKGLSFKTPDSDHKYQPLEMFEKLHSKSEKTFLNTNIPADTQGRKSIVIALDTLFNHPNLAPFISRQLIQRFTSSHPSPDYVRRVASAFESGQYLLPDGSSIGQHSRGDLAATLAAVLFDVHARSDIQSLSASSGKIREPVLRFIQWARAFDIVNVDAANEKKLRRTNSLTALGQQPFMADSVFNFYTPHYIAPHSASGNAGLTAPELQIINETTQTAYVNFMSRFIRNKTPNQNRSINSYEPNYHIEVSLADQPEALVERLDLLLTYGQLEISTKQRIIDLLNEIPIRTRQEQKNRTQRVHLAVLMMTTSPEYFVQK